MHRTHRPWDPASDELSTGDPALGELSTGDPASAGFRALSGFRFCAAAIFAAVLLTVGLRADDWPEIRGSGRLGVWNETGIVEKFPEKGLNVLWRTPLK